ncbi:hypothetical protein [Paracoccus sp. DMF]|uniref:hypothetical protein n=1 Tax=Paracoccus sp. DMF TaxID=400837 RepID=UPI0021E4DE8F|nr:hypothetical protein [Paracoccus sp. DMF]
MRFYFFNVGIEGRSLAFQPIKQAGIVGRPTNYGLRLDACRAGVCLDAGDDVMYLMHAADSAKRHRTMQVPIDLWRQVPNGALIRAMSSPISRAAFRDALEWHIKRTGISPAQICAESGVTSDVIKKLRSPSRTNNSTGVENAIPIAAVFGMTVEKFLRMEEPDSESRLKALSDLLLPEEERLLEAQVLGIIQARGRKSSPQQD